MMSILSDLEQVAREISVIEPFAIRIETSPEMLGKLVESCSVSPVTPGSLAVYEGILIEPNDTLQDRMYLVHMSDGTTKVGHF